MTFCASSAPRSALRASKSAALLSSRSAVIFLAGGTKISQNQQQPWRPRHKNHSYSLTSQLHNHAGHLSMANTATMSTTALHRRHPCRCRAHYHCGTPWWWLLSLLARLAIWPNARLYIQSKNASNWTQSEIFTRQRNLHRWRILKLFTDLPIFLRVRRPRIRDRIRLYHWCERFGWCLVLPHTITLRWL